MSNEKLKMKNKIGRTRVAFSLVEAMIILVLISVAIMALIPLMTQRASIPKWATTTDNTFYGMQPNERVGVGNGINPYTTPAKFAAGTLAVKTTNPDDNLTSVLWNDWFFSDNTYNVDPETDVGKKVVPPIISTNSTIIGMNTCKSPANNSTAIFSMPVDTTYWRQCYSDVTAINNSSINITSANPNECNTAANCDANTLYIDYRGHGGVPVDSEREYEVKLKKQAAGGDDLFAFRVGNKEVMSYDGTNLTIPNNVTLAGDGLLYLSTKSGDAYEALKVSNDSSPNNTENNILCDLKCIVYQDETGTNKFSSEAEAAGLIASGFTFDWVEVNAYNPEAHSCNPPAITAIEGGQPACKKRGDADIKFCYDNDPNKAFWPVFSSQASLHFVERDFTTTPPSKKISQDMPFIRDYTTSDKRLKNIVAPYVKGAADISKIDTYRFTYKSDSKQTPFVGIIAQNLIGIFDEALHTDEKGYYSYEKTPLLYSMTNGAKEIDQKQKNILENQKRMSSDADKLIKMYK